MYFFWKEFPLIAPDNLVQQGAPVIIIGGGPVGLAIALGLARYGVPCTVLESRSTISTGSRALAMNRRSMQILDQLGIGSTVVDKGLRWSAGWTFYGKHLVHQMDIASPPHEKHGQTNLQQCWMEQLLLDAIHGNPLIEVRYQHEVVAIDPREDRVNLRVKTPAGEFKTYAHYLVAADGPRGTTRRAMGLDYEGTSYSQRFVINDIICRIPIPDGRRLFFSPPYLPGKTVLMHKAPFDMWRLDFQLMDDQDAEEEMKPDKVHERIRAHFELMGLKPDYELVLTSVYKANAVSLPTYNSGRVVFAGDAAHQVPIFGGRGVNHGYEDAHNLAWKLAFVVKGLAREDLLDTYTHERREAILHTLADLTKTTLFITTPSPGLALVREAVLSLSLSENFVGDLFDPYASKPYEPADSVLNSTSEPDSEFGEPCRPGALVPDMVIAPNGQRLYDLLGPYFTVLQFGEQAPTIACSTNEPALSRETGGLPVQVVKLPANGMAADLFDARPGTSYLIRPDNRIAGRWRRPNASWFSAAVRTAALPIKHELQEAQ